MTDKNLEKVFEELEKIGKISEKFDLSYEISTEPKLSFNFGWETKVKGLWITFSREGHLTSTMYALPITSINTNIYGPYYFGGTPPAANLVRINKNIMLFSSDENTPPSDFIEEIFTKSKPISEVLPMCAVSQRNVLLDVELTDPVCVDAPASNSKEEILEEVKNMSEILAVGIATSGYPNKEIIAKSDIE